MNYGEIIKTAFSITRHNRYLWFFGLFAGGGASFNVPTGNFNAGSPGGGGGQDNPFDQGIPEIDPGLILGAIAVVLVLVLVAVALSLISQGALVDSVAAIDRGGERRFKTAWRAGTRTFWRVLGFALLLFVIVLGVLIVIGVPLAGIVIGTFAATAADGARVAVVVVVALIALAAVVLILIPIQIIGQLALRELLLREERPVASLRHAYRLVRANLGSSFLLWLIQVGIGIGVAIVLVIALVIVGIVLALPAIGLAVAQVVVPAIIAGVLAALVLIAAALVAFGALGTFTHAYWTLAYLRLTRLGSSGAGEQPQPAA